MPRGRKRGTKLVDYKSYPFSFRLTDSDADKRYLDLMNEWIEIAPGRMRSHKIVTIIKGLIDKFTGYEPQVLRPAIDTDEIKMQIMDELKDWVRGLIADSTRMGVLVEAHSQVSTGGEVPDDVLDNIMADFMNDGI